MTPIQCRLARTALNWGVRDLANKAEVSSQTVSRLEAGDELKPATIDKLKSTLESAGILFIDEDKTAGEGVRFAKPAGRRKRKSK